jgi:hypothetical protein
MVRELPIPAYRCLHCGQPVSRYSYGWKHARGGWSSPGFCRQQAEPTPSVWPDPRFPRWTITALDHDGEQSWVVRLGRQERGSAPTREEAVELLTSLADVLRPQ